MKGGAMKSVTLFPCLIESWTDPNGNRFFMTDRGGWGVGFELTPLELELQYVHTLQSTFQKLTLYFRKLDPSLLS